MFNRFVCTKREIWICDLQIIIWLRKCMQSLSATKCKHEKWFTCEDANKNTNRNTHDGTSTCNNDFDDHMHHKRDKNKQIKYAKMITMESIADRRIETKTSSSGWINNKKKTTNKNHCRELSLIDHHSSFSAHKFRVINTISSSHCVRCGRRCGFLAIVFDHSQRSINSTNRFY